MWGPWVPLCMSDYSVVHLQLPSKDSIHMAFITAKRRNQDTITCNISEEATLPLGFRYQDRVQTPKGPAYVMGVETASGLLYFRLEYEDTCSTWAACTTRADYKARGFVILQCADGDPAGVVALNRLREDAAAFLDQQWASSGGAPRSIPNCCIGRACRAYELFMRAVGRVSEQQKRPYTGPNSFLGVKIRFCFHGTTTIDGVPIICCEGFDTSRRGSNGQAHGAGEYFATDPAASKQYTGGANHMLLCVVIDGPWVTVPTLAPNFVVVRNPTDNGVDMSYCLPLSVLVFGPLKKPLEINYCSARRRPQ